MSESVEYMLGRMDAKLDNIERSNIEFKQELEHKASTQALNEVVTQLTSVEKDVRELKDAATTAATIKANDEKRLSWLFKYLPHFLVCLTMFMCGSGAHSWVQMVYKLL